jgi:hypothetical protein
MTRQTSLIAFRAIKDEGLLGKMQMVIFNAIRFNPDRTDKEISYIADLSINCVTPRRGELQKKSIVIGSKSYRVVEAGKRNCTITGRMAMTWTIGEVHR